MTLQAAASTRTRARARALASASCYVRTSQDAARRARAARFFFSTYRVSILSVCFSQSCARAHATRQRQTRKNSFRSGGHRGRARAPAYKCGQSGERAGGRAGGRAGARARARVGEERALTSSIVLFAKFSLSISLHARALAARTCCGRRFFVFDTVASCKQSSICVQVASANFTCFHFARGRARCSAFIFNRSSKVQRVPSVSSLSPLVALFAVVDRALPRGEKRAIMGAKGNAAACRRGGWLTVCLCAFAVRLPDSDSGGSSGGSNGGSSGGGGGDGSKTRKLNATFFVLLVFSRRFSQFYEKKRIL